MPLADSLIWKVRVGVHDGKGRVVFNSIPAGGVLYRVTADADPLPATFKPDSGFPSRQGSVPHRVRRGQGPSGLLGNSSDGH